MSRTAALVDLALRHPTWALERLLVRFEPSEGALPAPALDELSGLRDRADGVDAVLAAVTGQPEEVVARHSTPSWRPDAQADDAVADSRDPLLRAVYAAVRLLEPEAMVEVGVERGYSSAVALRALAENGHGRLYSIDLPPLGRDAERGTGRLVPEELRDRWELALGPARRLLPRVARAHAPLDLVVLDGDHSRSAQLRELRAVWPHLRRGGVIVCDDVWSSAFPDFATSVGESAHYVARPAGDAIGFLRRSSASA